MADRSPPPTRSVSLAVLLVLAAAAVLRVWGIGFGLPYAFEARPDEREIVHTAVKFFEGNLRPQRFSYPGLFYYALYLCYWALVGVGVAAGVISGPYDMRYLYVAGPDALHITARLLSAAFGVATVYVTWRLGRRAFGRRTGLLAAVFLAVAYLHGRDSHFGVTDVAMTFFVALAHLPILDLLRTARRKAYVLTGLAAGLGISTKYNAAVLAAPTLAAHALAGPRRSWRGLVLCFFVCVAAYLAASPYTLIEWKEFWGDVHYEVFVHGLQQTHAGDAGRGWTRHLTVSLRYGLGLPMCLAAAAGMAAALARRPRPAAVLLTWPLAYYAVLGPRRTVFVRYAIPLLPSLCLFAGYAASRWLAWARRRGRAARGVAAAALLAIVAPTLTRLVQFDDFISRLDTRDLAAMWLQRHMTEKDRVAWLGTKYMLAAPPIELQARRRAGNLVFQVTTMKQFDEVKPTFVVTCGHRVLSCYCWFSPQIARRLQAAYELAAEFDPDGAETQRDVYDVQDAFFAPYAGFHASRRPGPKIRIYRLRRPRR